MSHAPASPFPRRSSSAPGARGSRRRAPARAQGCTRPLVVTDRGTRRAAGLRASSSADLDAALDAAVFSGICGNPVRSQVMAGAAAFRAHRADSVIGIGGGAALDVAKAIALMATHPGDILEYAWDHPQVRPIDAARCRTSSPCPRPPAPASEVGRSSVISDDVTHVKKIIFSPAAAGQGRVRRSRADARPAAGDHRGHRHGRAHPQRRVVPVAGVPSAVRRHRARGRAHRRARACRSPCASRRDLEGARRHADELDDGRDRVPEGPRRRALVRARAVDRRRPAPRPRERHHDRPRAALQPATRRRRSSPSSRASPVPAATPADERARGFVDWLRDAQGASSASRRSCPTTRRRARHAADIPRLVEIAVADICHQTNPRPCTAEDFGASSRRRCRRRMAAPLLIGVSALLLSTPTSGSSARLQGQDAAVPRAVGRALGDVERTCS